MFFYLPDGVDLVELSSANCNLKKTITNMKRNKKSMVPNLSYFDFEIVNELFRKLEI